MSALTSRLKTVLASRAWLTVGLLWVVALLNYLDRHERHLRRGGVGGYIAEHFGWRAGFNLFGAFGVGYAVLTLFFLRDVAAPPAAPNRLTDSPGA
jgi:hypothetical protein